MNFIFLTFVPIALSLMPSCAQKQVPINACENHLRALIDVGSATTKLNLSEVALCPGDVHLLRVIDDQQSIPVPLDSGKSPDDSLTLEIQEQELKAITDLRDKALALARDRAGGYKTVDFTAIGTQAFRTASNRAVFAEKVKALGLPIVEISPTREGEFGYRSVAALGVNEACKQRNLVVWDVGGGSMELTRKDEHANLRVEPVAYGAETFKRKLIAGLPARKPKKGCLPTPDSPNPVGWMNSSKAALIAEDLAKTYLAKEYQIDANTSCVVGIGGVHNQAIENQVKRTFPALRSCVCAGDVGCTHFAGSYTRKEVQCLALYLSEKSDCDNDLKGPFVSTGATNAFMILGFMERLKINQVLTLDVNIGRDVILDNNSIQWQTIPVSALDKKN